MLSFFQACGCTLVKGIHGDYFNVKGFPAHRLYNNQNEMYTSLALCLLCKQCSTCYFVFMKVCGGAVFVAEKDGLGIDLISSWVISVEQASLLPVSE